MAYQDSQLDALGDPTRRGILVCLIHGPMAVGQVARQFPISRPAISQHLRVLKNAQLVVDRAAGNRRLYQLNPEAFETLREYFDQFWGQALSAFRREVEKAGEVEKAEQAEQALPSEQPQGRKPARRKKPGGAMNSAEPSRQSGKVQLSPTPMQDAPVRKSITVKANAQRAFDVFTAGFDRWWPRSHHIGSAPMKRAIVEGRVGGRCYSEQTDGTECDWGEITAWEPPQRFVMAWKITADWKYQPDVAKASEVEVRFTPLEDGSTRVDLEHRRFDRMGAGWETMRGMVDAEGGWGGLLQLFAAEAQKSE